jgi:protein ImuA
MNAPIGQLSAREKLTALRQQLAGTRPGRPLAREHAKPLMSSAAQSVWPLGIPAIDAHLGGGLIRAALHEIAGIDRDAELAALPAFLASQLIRRCPGRSVIWISSATDLYGPGLQAQGLDPARLLLVQTHHDQESLWALEESARSGAVSLAIGEIDNLDLTASRRLQLAAEEKGCMILALRRSRIAGKGEKHRHPSAAMTRWLISPRPGRPIGQRPGLGHPCWRLQLWRQRNGPPGSWDITLQDHELQHVKAEPANSIAAAANDHASPYPTRQHTTTAETALSVPVVATLDDRSLATGSERRHQ